MPLPDIAVERRFLVDFELMDINRLAEQRLRRFDQTRMARQAREYAVVGVNGKGDTHRVAVLFAPNLGPALRENGR